MTKREMFMAIASVPEVASNQEMVDFLNRQIELLDNHKTSKTPTKTQKENEGIMNTIELVLAETGKKMTVTELISTESLNSFSNQKISALLRLMIKAGRVVKTVEKKTAYFAIA